MELQQILSKMEADGWEISNDFKIAHGHFLQYFLETVEAALRQPTVSGRSEQLKAFVDEFIEAWEDGNGGDSYLYRKAKSL